MIPGEYHIYAAANSQWSETFAVGVTGLTSTTGYTARLDIRAGTIDSSTLLLSLTTSDGITLSVTSIASTDYTGAALGVTPTITAAQMDTLRAAMLSNNLDYVLVAGGFKQYRGYYSLQVTTPTSVPLVYLIGTFNVIDTTTP